MSYDGVLVLHASAAETTNFTSAGIGIPAGATVGVLINVTVATGTTPSFTPTLQWSHDGVTWAGVETPDSFTALVTTGAVVKQFMRKGNFLRLTGAITGTTPSFTFVSTVAPTGV